MSLLNYWPATVSESDATADNEKGTATVHGDADPDDLVAAVEDAGYDATE